jgi:hypothetical protein
MNAEKVAYGLGWFSIALGASEVLGAEKMSRYFKSVKAAPLVRGYGAREIAAGVGLLSGRKPALWMWARVLGDVLDVLALAEAMKPDNRGHKRTRAGVALLMVMGVTALDLVCALQLTRKS